MSPEPMESETTEAAATDYDAMNKKWTKDAQIFEYGSAANPEMKPIPVLIHPPVLHESGQTNIIPSYFSNFLDIDIPCTSPN